MAEVGRVLEPVKRRVADRTEIRHRCPWLRRPRRVGTNELREIGNLAPYVRNKGCLPFTRQIAETRTLRLSNNNIGDRQAARPRTITESCSVRVSEHPLQWGEGPVNGGGNYDPLKVA